MKSDRSNASTAWHLLLVVLAAALVLARWPQILSAPRLWAEEGELYLADALRSPGLSSLLRDYYVGYYNLTANLAALLAARLLPLEYVPYLTVLISLLVQLVPVAIIATSQAPFWRSELKKALAILITIYTPFTSEIWLNTIASQFYLALAVFLILIESDEIDGPLGSLRRHLLRLGTGVAGLSGVMSLFLAPLFLLRLIERKERRGRETLAHFLILTGCAAWQLLALIRNLPTSAGSRFAGFDTASYVLTVAIRTVYYPIFNGQYSQNLVEELLRLHDQNPWLYHRYGWLAAAGLLGMVAWVAWGLGRRLAPCFIGAWLLLCTLSFASAIGPKHLFVQPEYGGRYFYVPAVIFLLALLHMAGGVGRLGGVAQRMAGGGQMDWRELAAGLSGLAALLLVLTSIYQGHHNYGLRQFAEPGFPRWRDEVAHHRRDPSYRTLHVWPDWKMRDWVVRLPDSPSP